MKFVSHSPEETKMYAQHYARGILKLRLDMMQKGQEPEKAFIIGLYGNLGSGKTAFTQAIASTLGVEEGITSPTFVIEKIYPLVPSLSIGLSTGDSQVVRDSTDFAQVFTHLIHIDAYRLESSEEMRHLGWDEIAANPRNLVVIEWPERIADLLPADHERLNFTFVDETTREIEIQ